MSKTKPSFEKILSSVGDNGRHQSLLFWLLVVPFNFIVPWVPLAPIFLSSAPNHRCMVPGKPHNVSEDVWNNYTIPWEKNEGGDYFLSHCMQYNISEKDTTSVTDYASPSFDTVVCQHGWMYDQSEYQETITTKENWVCDNKNYISHWLSVGLAGNVIGTLVFNTLSDFYGRKPIFLISCLLCAVFGVARVYVTSLSYIMIIQFLASLPFPSNLELGLILVYEQSSGGLRPRITAASFILWTAGMCFLPLLAWATQDWVILGLITSVPFFLCIPGWWLLSESPRWSLSRGDVETTFSLLKQISKCNKKTPPDNLYQSIKDLQACDKPEANYGALQLLYYPIVWKRTILLTLCYTCNNAFYYGLLYNISNMSGNEFLNFFLLGITELPANILGWWGAGVIGRRITETVCFCLASVFALLTIAVLDWSPWWNTAVLIISKLIITISFMVIYIMCAEIYPTSHRASGTGLSSLVSSIVGISAPYIATLNNYWMPLPYVIISVIGLVGSICASLLPETLGADLPQSLQDGASFLVNQPFFSYYGWRPKNQSNIQGTENPALTLDETNLNNHDVQEKTKGN